MKRISLLVGLLFIGPYLLQAQTIHLDSIVAIVEDGVVTESQLDRRVASIKQRFVGAAGQLPPDNVLREQILDRLILEELQLQLAARMGLEITDAQLGDAITNIAASNGLGPEQFLQNLADQGGGRNQVLSELRNELTLQQLQQMNVSRRIFVSEAEIQNFLNSSEGQFWAAPDYQLQHIMLPLAANASPDRVQAVQSEMNEILAALSRGDEFGTLAVQYSEGPSALEGGELGWRKAAEFPPEISEVIVQTSVGEVSAPVRSAGALHLFKVNAVQRAEDISMVQQTKVRHILVSPNEIRSDEESRQLAERIQQRLLDGESFEELAKTYSEDISNALKGGDLGWIMPGQLVPPFEEAMNEISIGAISAPVRTQFGWHVIRVDNRRDVDMTDDIMRQQARNLLRNQRFEEELDLWLRELRTDAFVKILDQDT